MDDFLTLKPDGLSLQIRVTPAARRNALEGIWNKTHLRVALQAPAVDGKANEALICFLAKTLGVKKKNIFIVTGETSRCKLIFIKEESTEERMKKAQWLKQKLSMEKN